MNNTIYIPRPSQDQYNQLSCGSCGSGCNGNGLGPADPLVPVGPRRNREKVREQIKDYVFDLFQ